LILILSSSFFLFVRSNLLQRFVFAERRARTKRKKNTTHRHGSTHVQKEAAIKEMTNPFTAKPRAFLHTMQKKREKVKLRHCLPSNNNNSDLEKEDGAKKTQ
jgi:hypothetical protein